MIRRGAPIDRMRFDDGVRALRHRGPDAQRIAYDELPPRFASPDLQRALGHTRLSIIDINARSDQPFQLAQHKLVYNGEVYNFRELAASIRAEGVRFDTEGDTEILLRLLMRDGVDGLRKVNGMWAFCWFDDARRTLIAARDRYGKKPLFYAMTNEAICFASEIGALMTALGRKPQAAPGAIATFLREGWLFPRADGATHIEAVREVRPGHCVEIDLDRWRLSERPICPFDDHIGSFESPPLDELVADAVEARLVADRKVGLLLSGGVDSSLIFSVLAKRGLIDQVVCITGDAGKSDDALYARRCLDAVGRSALEIKLNYGGESVDQFLDVCGSQAKPFPLIGNVLGMAALYQAIGAEDIRVVLDGSGGDEIFGGYWQRYAGFAMRDAARADDRAWLDEVRASGFLPASLAQLSDRAIATDAPPTPSIDGLDARDQSLLSKEGQEGLLTAENCDPLVNFDGTLAQALALDARAGRMQEWLWQNDRNAMAASVENRSPFLDHRLAHFVNTPYRAKIGGRWNKLELRRLFERFTPLPTATRADKQGFRWVYGRFLRNNRARIVELIRASTIARQFVDLDRCLASDIDDQAFLESRLVQRLLPIAGLEAAGGLA